VRKWGRTKVGKNVECSENETENETAKSGSEKKREGDASGGRRVEEKRNRSQ
jgi:hypothetical protein